MNKVNLIGRLTQDVETVYTQSSTPTAISKFKIAVNRTFKKEGQPEADFINIVTFGKTAEFVSKYFSKGLQVGVSGRIQTGSYKNKDGATVYTTDVLAEEVYFADGKKGEGKKSDSAPKQDEGFVAIELEDEDLLPF